MNACTFLGTPISFWVSDNSSPIILYSMCPILSWALFQPFCLFGVFYFLPSLTLFILLRVSNNFCTFCPAFSLSSFSLSSLSFSPTLNALPLFLFPNIPFLCSILSFLLFPVLVSLFSSHLPFFPPFSPPSPTLSMRIR